MSLEGMVGQVSLNVRAVQDAVDRMVQENGGYWRPASAAFHLYEQLLALDEATFPAILESGALAPVDPDVVHPHLVRIFVAATCIATQYSVDLPNAFRELQLHPDLESHEYGQAAATVELRRTVLGVKRDVAKIARVVTFYDFEDVSADAPGLPRIAGAVPRLLVNILKGFESAAAFRAAFRTELRHPHSPRRYKSPFDPGTAPILEKIAPIRNKTLCPFARASRLWGAPDYDSRLSFNDNMHRSIPSLRVFIRVAQREPLDGYVYGFPVDPETHTVDDVARITKQLIFFLAWNCNGDDEDTVRKQLLADPERWRFELYGEECFVNVFSPAYPGTHTRFTYEIRDTMFVMLQPETSFHMLIPKKDFHLVRGRIRDAFEEKLQGYSLEDAEAHRFVLPLEDDDEPVRWYDLDVLE